MAKGKVAEILYSSGDLDSALRILKAEVVPVLDKHGDVRMLAVAKGHLARVHEARGDLDAAIAMHLENMPAAERTGDAQMKMSISSVVARLRLARGVSSQEEAQQVYDDLAESYAIARRMGLPPAIVGIGSELARFLADADAPAEAAKIADEVADALAKLGQAENAAAVRAEAAQLRANSK